MYNTDNSNLASDHCALDDKSVELNRYESRAISLLESSSGIARCDQTSIPIVLREPYLFYEEQVSKYVTAGSRILEIGSGTGMHTGVLLEAGGDVVATDISSHSLDVLQNRFMNSERLSTHVADMESLPFADDSFDVVASAGSLSYGDNLRVMAEVFRVLKQGGVFVCVDSLNHNPIYRLNRWLHYRRGNRTLNTLKRMPLLQMIEQYRQKFGAVDTRFFGTISWLTPLTTRLFGDKIAAKLSKIADRVFCVKRSAFKFVMVVRKD